ncbi:MAG: carboxyl transferase domain-containing protein [Acidimicrobiia bacterium]
MADEQPAPPPATHAAPRRVVLRLEERWEDLLGTLERDRAAAHHSAGGEQIRAALAELCDGGFTEVGLIARGDLRSYRADDAPATSDDADAAIVTDGLVAGWGHRRGRLLFCSADHLDRTAALRTPAASAKARRLREHARASAAPLVSIRGADGAPADGGVGAAFVTAGIGIDLAHEHEAARLLPRLTIVTGPLRAGAALEAAAADVVILAGPQASLALGASPAMGGAEALAAGAADAVTDTLEQAVALLGDWLDLLPANPWDGAPEPPGPDAAAPAAAAVAAPARAATLVDGGTWLELRPGHAAAARTGLARIGGTVSGVAVLDETTGLGTPAAYRKVDRLLRWCEALRLPLVVIHGALAPVSRPDAALLAAHASLQRRWAAATTTTVAVPLDPDRPGLAALLGHPATVALPADAASGTGPGGLARILAGLPPSRPVPWEPPYATVDRERNLFSKH